LTRTELEAVRDLAATCVETSGQDLKLVLGEPLEEPGEACGSGQFLAVAGGRVIDYGGVDEGQDAEVCGMVHPDHRGCGVGAALLDACLRAASETGRKSVLVICEEAAPLAIDWMRRGGAELDSSELRMVLRLDAPDTNLWPVPGPQVDLRQSTPGDRKVLRNLLADGFPAMDAETLDLLLSRHDAIEEESLIIWSGDRAVGALRIIDTPKRSMIYGLVVDSVERGKGFGAAAMRQALELLRKRGVEEVSLEVLPDNGPAVHIYSALGFRPVTTYRYMRVGCGQISARG